MAGKRSQRIGWAGYARVLRCVVDGPVHRNQVEERCNVGRTAARALLNGLHGLGVIRIAGWHHQPRQAYTPLFGYGSDPDAPYPALLPRGVPCGNGYKPWTTAPKAELIAFVHILRELAVPQTLQELHHNTGSAEYALRGLIAVMRDLRLVRVGEWSHRGHGGLPVAHYELAIDRRDAKQPRKQAKNDVNKRYRDAQRLKAQTLQIVHALAGNASTYQAAA